MQRPRLLWVRMADFAAAAVPHSTAEEYFKLHVCSVSEVHAAMSRFVPQVVCFDFEQTQAVHLRAMRDFKRLHPSVPLLMMTAQHSEALAVWAFRVRVWNFLVKPIRTSELRANFDVLARLVSEDRTSPRAARCVGTLIPEDAMEPSSLAAQSPLDSALRFIESNYASKIRQSAAAAVAGMTVYTFSRAFKAEYGVTFREYVLRYRIGRACEMLKEGAQGATDAGIAVGFEDASHFSRAFRRVVGISPSAFQRREADARMADDYWSPMPVAAQM